MNEEIKQAQETLLELSSLALKYLVNNFNYENEEYLKLKKEIGNLTDRNKVRNEYFELKLELEELKDFTRIVLTKGIDAPLIKEYPNIDYVDYNMKSRFELGNYTKTEFELVKKVVERYAKKEG